MPTRLPSDDGGPTDDGNRTEDEGCTEDGSRAEGGDREEATRLSVRRILLLVAAGLLLAGAASAEPLAPNELGRVMILEYHKIDRPEEPLDAHPRELPPRPPARSGSAAIGSWPSTTPRRAIRCRAGRHRSILTFDDSSPGQFRYLERNGDWVIDPDCAVGILEAFEREHPEFGHAATFYVLPGADPAQPPLQPARARQRKLQYLASRGYEIGNHTLWHANLGKYDETVGAPQLADGPGLGAAPRARLSARTLALPHGRLPAARSAGSSRAGQGHRPTATTPS